MEFSREKMNNSDYLISSCMVLLLRVTLALPVGECFFVRV